MNFDVLVLFWYSVLGEPFTQIAALILAILMVGITLTMLARLIYDVSI